MTAVAPAMASPAMVDKLFCGKLPGGVPELLFAFGFHLWLARPFDIKRWRTAYTGPDYVGQELRLTTVHLVLETQLCESARRMVWSAYAASFNEIPTFPTNEWHLAKPFTIQGDDVEHVLYRGKYLLILREHARDDD